MFDSVVIRERWHHARSVRSKDRSSLLVPPSAMVTASATRRSFLRSAALGGVAPRHPGPCSPRAVTTAMVAAEAVAAGPSASASTRPWTPGRRTSATQGLADAYAEKSGVEVNVNYVDHNTFQENINTYLQGSPGRRLHLVRRLPDAAVRRERPARRRQRPVADRRHGRRLQGGLDASTASSTSCPTTTTRGRCSTASRSSRRTATRLPTTLRRLHRACPRRCRARASTPIAFGDKDGWPAMGTFDILNMRINGFDFHMSLMAGDEAWDSTEVKKVFETWRDLLPYHQEDPLGRTWQEAATSLANGEAGMYLLGTFVADAIPDDSRRPRLLHLPGDRRQRSAPTPSTRRSTASAVAAAGAEPGRRQGRSWRSSAPPRRRTPPTPTARRR